MKIIKYYKEHGQSIEEILTDYIITNYQIENE